ncbi:hypothetical protein VTL71DRAFT_7973, partial [Oculimacula yallundae]
MSMCIAELRRIAMLGIPKLNPVSHRRTLDFISWTQLNEGLPGAGGEMIIKLFGGVTTVCGMGKWPVSSASADNLEAGMMAVIRYIDELSRLLSGAIHQTKDSNPSSPFIIPSCNAVIESLTSYS